MPDPNRQLDEQYRRAQLALEAQVQSIIDALYDETMDPADIDAAFEELIPQAAVVVSAGQAAGISLATGYLAALLTLNGRDASLPVLDGLVGTSGAGSLADGMGAWSTMVKGQIAKGVAVEEALDYGRYLADRFSTSEVLRATDTQHDFAAKTSGRFRGWEGELAAGACGPCGDNAGFHEMGDTLYRHGSCRCSKRYLVA